MASKVEFADKSQEAKNAILKEQYAALYKAGSEILKAVRAEARKVNDKRKRKTNWGNIAVRTYTRTKYGFVVAHIGFKSAAKAKGDPSLTEEYELQIQYGTRSDPGNPYLSRTVSENIPLIRDTLAQYLPNIKGTTDDTERDEIIE